ncbi:hypothetical protein DPMN_124535 [Dreissena polymorpha]|uniref:Secreted protein n=1 Tax=Dreissena polymorpha TaxID=45954 RepID=A0A9D4GTF4_DREPO|nr:hypothetical protein DPMN_124535 [Dreissena polymorpha]
MALMFALLSWLMKGVGSGLSMFSMTIRPRKVRPRSTCSLETRKTFNFCGTENQGVACHQGGACNKGGTFNQAGA